MSNLLFLDAETTGLDPAKDIILEVAVEIVSPDLTSLAKGSWLVTNDIEAVIGRCDDFVLKMHEDNGLLGEIAREEPSKSLADIESAIMSLAREHGCIDANVGGKRYQSPLCGSNPAFDRGFLRVAMPQLARAISYRHVDVSTLIELVERWYQPLPSTLSVHRAASDVQRSIACLRQIKGRYFSPYNPKIQGPSQ